jgi:membrane protease YdiL (CAAX protease family)
MSYHYLDAARQGKNNWWRYLIGILAILIGMLIVGSIAALISAILVMGLRGQDVLLNFEAQLETFLKESSIPAFAVNHLPHVLGLIVLLVVVRFLHGRPITSLIAADNTIRWGRIAWGFGIWWLLLMGADLISFLFFDRQVYLQGWQQVNWQAWLSFLPVTLLLTPIQTTTEELFFRGYLMQGVGLLTRNSLLLYILGGLFFAVPHFLNPEMARGGWWMGLAYFAMGVFGVLITLKDNRLELAIGEHAANNLYIVLFSNSEDSVLKSPAVVIHPPPNPQVSFFSIVILMTIAYIFFFVWPGRAAKNP